MSEEELIEDLKRIYKEDRGVELTDQEAREAYNSLMGLTKIIYDQWVRDNQRKQKLEENPGGFHLTDSGQYNCILCKHGMQNETTWFDKWGLKCIDCQKAIDKKIIPGSLLKKDGDQKYYTRFDLEYYLLLKTVKVNKLIKEGVLKSRVIESTNNYGDTYLFLIKDNKDFLPPKEMIKSQGAYRDEEGFTRTLKWCEYQDGNDLLKKYNITKYINYPAPIYKKNTKKHGEI